MKALLLIFRRFSKMMLSLSRRSSYIDYWWLFEIFATLAFEFTTLWINEECFHRAGSNLYRFFLSIIWYHSSQASKYCWISIKKFAVSWPMMIKLTLFIHSYSRIIDWNILAMNMVKLTCLIQISKIRRYQSVNCPITMNVLNRVNTTIMDHYVSLLMSNGPKLFQRYLDGSDLCGHMAWVD